MVYSSFATVEMMLAQITVQHLMLLVWTGDEKAKAFHDQWLDIVPRMECRLDVKALMSMLWAQIRQSDKVVTSCYEWKKKAKAQRSYRYDSASRRSSGNSRKRQTKTKP